MEMLRKIIDSKSLENSQENMMEFDLVKLQFCNLNTATLPKTSQILSGINLEWPNSLESELCSLCCTRFLQACSPAINSPQFCKKQSSY